MQNITNHKCNENFLWQYSFKIFRRFWLAKIPSIIHHNQPLSTKFRRILRYWTDDVNRATKLTDYWTVNQEDLGTSLSCFRCEYIKGGTFYSFHGELLSKNMARAKRRQLVEIVGKAVWMIGLRWQFGSVSPFYQSDRKLLIPVVM